MEISCVVIDDEPNNIQNLISILQAHCVEINVVATALSADDGITAIQKFKPNLVFLDVQMPKKSGFEVLKAFTNPEFEVIFITAYDQYGVQAIKFSALDYLLKPVNIDELKIAIAKTKKRLLYKERDSKLDNLIEYIKLGHRDPPKIALPTFKEIRYVRVDELIRCQASDNYTTFYTVGGDQILVCKTLKEFAELLQPHGFVRTHQSHLANIQYIKSLLKEDGGMLLMNDLTKLPVSRQHKESLKEALKTL
jgi:two-component system LytT family response regulator